MKHAIILLSLLLSLSACGLRRVAPEVEAEASLATTQWLDQKYGFENNAELSSMLHRITERLKGAVYGHALELDLSGRYVAEFGDYPWQVYVLDMDQPNAFSAGGGVIIVSRGLVKSLASEGELAAVISHEMAHHLLGHISNAIYKIGLSSDSPRYAFSVDDELAADTVGLRILAVARYAPEQAISAIASSYKARHEGISTPCDEVTSERLANLKAKLAKLPPSLPAEVTSREFERVQGLL